jgi:hypothetical protein
MIEWTPISGSTRLVAEGYDPENETIYVRFPDGVEWWYAACPREVWEEYSAPGQSRGQYIARVLNFKPNGRFAG